MSDHKRILVIEDDPDYQRLLAAVFAGCGDTFETTTAQTLGEAQQALEVFTPDLILADLMLPDSSGYATFQRLRELAGGAPIVILTGLDDDGLAVQAVEDGAQDYLVKSLVQPKLVMRCVQMALGRQQHQTGRSASGSTGAVLSFIGSKGGVGTSVTAVNVAAALSQFGHDTVLVEYPGGVGTSWMYLNRASSGSLQALVAQPVSEITAAGLRRCLVEVAPGLHLTCAGACREAGRVAGGGEARALVTAARQICPNVVLDLPPRLDEGIAVALKLADAIVLMVDREVASVDCAAALLTQIKAIGSPGREIRLALVDRSVQPALLPLAEVKARLKQHPLVIVPAAAEDLAASYAARTPLVFLCPGGNFSRVHQELAERLMGPGHSMAGTERRLRRKTEELAPPEMAYS